MKKNEVCALIREVGVIPAVRVWSGDDAHFAAEAVTTRRHTHCGNHNDRARSGGADFSSLQFQSKDRGRGRDGLDTETARHCVDAGASFMTAPVFNPTVVEFAAKARLAVLPGALTPTEVVEHGMPARTSSKCFPAPSGGRDTSRL